MKWNSLMNKKKILERALHICCGLSESWKHETLHRISDEWSPEKKIEIKFWQTSGRYAYCISESVILINDRNRSQCKGEDLSSQWAFSILQFPCWYVTWAQIEIFLIGISWRSEEVQGPKDEIISRFAISLDASIYCSQFESKHG